MQIFIYILKGITHIHHVNLFMSWILGCLSSNLTPEVKNKLSAIHPHALHSIISSNLYLAAGGLRETCLGGMIFSQASENKWVLCGLGIQKESDHCKLLSSSDWQAILSNPQPDLKALDGHFIICRWTGEQLEFHTDQLGLRTIYFNRTSNGTYFSTRLDWIAKLVRTTSIDFAALGSSWLTFNQLTDTSLLHGVQKLGPSGYARLDLNSSAIQSAPWTPNFTSAEPEQAISHLEALSKPRGDFSKITLGLSGGLDSRTLLAIMIQQNQALSLHSFGNERDPDIQVAKRISSNEGLPHTIFDEPIPPFSETLKLMSDYAAEVSLCEPATSILRLRYYSRLREQYKLLIDGGFGELARRQYLNRLLVKGKAALLSGNPSQIFPYLKITRANMFTEDVMAEMTMGVTQQIQAVWDTMPSLKDISPENFLDLLAVRTRVPNWGGLDQSRLDAQVVNYMPFVQPSFLELVFSLTTNIRANGLLFRQTIKKLKPSLSRHPLVKNNTTYPFRLTTIESWLWTKIKSHLGWTFIDNSRHIVLESIKHYVFDTLNSSTVKNYKPYQYSTIEKIVQKYYGGDKTLGTQLDWWLTFELWRQSLRVI